MKVQAPKGTHDILWPEIERWQRVEARVRDVMFRFGYSEIRTPIFEATELFSRGLGEATDIVMKEMYTFPDRKGRSLTLRPEGTASVVRAFVEHNLGATQRPFRGYYVGPIFRYERPQAGRFRQHHQVGAELLGAPGPEADFEAIDLFTRLLRELGLGEVQVRLNSVGDRTCRPQFVERLRDALRPHLASLSEDSRRRFDLNVLRIFDSKDPADRALLPGLPTMLEHLDEPSRAHHEALKRLLTAAGIDFVEDPRLVRGLDYYTRTVFEVHHSKLGAQSAVGGGGRYDNLVGECGGADTPAVGFSSGIERLLMALEQEGGAEPPPRRPEVMVVAAGEGSRAEAQITASRLRARFAVEVDLLARSMGNQLKTADRLGVPLVIVIGDDERAGGYVTLKIMATGEQRTVPVADLETEIGARLAAR